MLRHHRPNVKFREAECMISPSSPSHNRDQCIPAGTTASAISPTSRKKAILALRSDCRMQAKTLRPASSYSAYSMLPHSTPAGRISWSSIALSPCATNGTANTSGVDSVRTTGLPWSHLFFIIVQRDALRCSSSENGTNSLHFSAIGTSFAIRNSPMEQNPGSYPYPKDGWRRQAGKFFRGRWEVHVWR